MKSDPKPYLSRAAIEANIEYYKAKEQIHSQNYRQALEQSTYWLRELVELSNRERNETR